MRHKDKQWEKEIQKGPFASSSFTEEHKNNVLQQVAFMQNSDKRSATDGSEEGSDSRRSQGQVGTTVRSKHWRSRKVTFVAGMGMLVIASSLFVWFWNDGQLLQPAIEQVYPTAALQLSDDLTMDLLTDKMKRNVAITLRDDLGKQLPITKVQDLPVSGRVYVEAGSGSENEYAKIWLDAESGNLREVEMRGMLQPSELEHRYVRQIPSLLQSMDIVPSLKPVSVRRYVDMKQGEIEPTSYTTVSLENEASYGEIVWQEDEAISISGPLNPDQVSQTVLAYAKYAVEVMSGEPSSDLVSVHRTKDDEIGEDTIFFSFNKNYFVSITEGREGSGFTVGNANDFGEPVISNTEEMEAHHEELYNIDETLLRDNVGPLVQKIFNVDFGGYKLHRNAETLGIVTFELESTMDVFQIRYIRDGRIQMITRGEL